MPDNVRGHDHPSPVALLAIDVINALDFDGGKDLLRYALPMAENLARLQSQARSAGVPVIYANDNFGRWRSDFRTILDHCLHDDVPGEPIARLLHPQDDDYFILKAKNSAFYCTALDILLQHVGVRTMVLTGVSCNICVLFTANDAHMRNLRVIVPSDCVAAENEEDASGALELMAHELHVEVVPSAEIDFVALGGMPSACSPAWQSKDSIRTTSTTRPSRRGGTGRTRA
jgi:nicotinamidase-related amidase